MAAEVEDRDAVICWGVDPREALGCEVSGRERNERNTNRYFRCRRATLSLGDFSVSRKNMATYCLCTKVQS